jgi:hypothetical protein
MALLLSRALPWVLVVRGWAAAPTLSLVLGVTLLWLAVFGAMVHTVPVPASLVYVPAVAIEPGRSSHAPAP